MIDAMAAGPSAISINTSRISIAHIYRSGRGWTCTRPRGWTDPMGRDDETLSLVLSFLIYALIIGCYRCFRSKAHLNIWQSYHQIKQCMNPPFIQSFNKSMQNSVPTATVLPRRPATPLHHRPNDPPPSSFLRTTPPLAPPPLHHHHHQISARASAGPRG